MTIKRINKFPTIPGMDQELDRLVKQINGLNLQSKQSTITNVPILITSTSMSLPPVSPEGVQETLVLCNALAGAITVYLPAANINKGLIFNIKKIDSSVNVVTVDGNLSETIDGAFTKGINTQYTNIKIISDGSNWHII